MSYSAPVRVRLRYVTLDVFVERFSPNVTRGGLFLASRAPRPVGDQFPFEVQLATGEVVLAGEGKVIWIKEYNPVEPSKPHGMGVQFVQLTEPSRALLGRMLKVKAQLTSRGPGAPRGLTQPLSPVHLTAGSAPVDTNVDLATEHGFDEAVLRRALERSWQANGRPVEDELDGLLKADPAEPTTLAQALAELPRLLDPLVRRRTGAFRTLETIGSPSAVSQPASPPAREVSASNGSASNGTSSTSHGDE